MLTKRKLIGDKFGSIVLLILDECIYLMMDVVLILHTMDNCNRLRHKLN